MLITANSMTSRRSVAAAKRPMGLRRGSAGQEPATSLAMAAEFCRNASKPARCCPFDRAHDPVGSSRRRIGARLRAPVGGVRFTRRGARCVAAQAALLLVRERVVEGLEG